MSNNLYIWKPLLTAILCFFSQSIAALDIISLKTGGTLTGEIRKQDEDGSLFMALTDGSMRYVMVDEIAAITSDDVPFSISLTRNPKSHVSVFVGYEHNFPTSMIINKADIDAFIQSPGLFIGSDINVNINKSFSYLQGLEIGVSWVKANYSAKYNDSLLRASSDNSPSFFYCFINLPVQFAYNIAMGSKSHMLLHTGPVIGLNFCTTNSNLGDSSWDREVLFNYSNGRISLKTGSFNCQWRVGAKFVILNQFTFGIAYSFGLIDSFKNGKIYSLDVDNGLRNNSTYTQFSPKVRHNSLTLHFGAFF